MSFYDTANFWIENVLFGPIEWTTRAMDAAEHAAGPFAAFIVLALLVVPVMLGLFFTLMLTGLSVIALVLTCPVTLPVAVWLHRRKR